MRPNLDLERMNFGISKNNTKSFYVLLACVFSVSLIQTSYAQLDSEQITFSNNLLNDPAVQDILKKIEQTKKMIAELEQKEYEQNQAQENLQKIRDMTVQQLNRDLDEWERLWEKHSSKNAFDEFVNKKPLHVQGVFLDQFEFKEKKVNAGRIAMNQVLTNGGTMQDARNAYHIAASTQKIELIEVNAQLNIKHNLADQIEQQLFNSTGQIHISPVTAAKLSGLYSDYRTQPSYILANLDADTSKPNSDLKCNDGTVLVSPLTTGNKFCVDESISINWINNGIKGIAISGGVSSFSNVNTNPMTQCQTGHLVVYNIALSEYQCVLESTANEMVANNTAESHTLVDYILNKDMLKVRDDAIFEANQEILRINQEYAVKKIALESKFNELLENEDLLAKQKIQESIQGYRNGDITKVNASKQISEINNARDFIKEKILEERLDATNKLESELKNKTLSVKEYGNSSSLNVNWDPHNKTSYTSNENQITIAKPVSMSPNSDKIHLANIGVVNSFGQTFDIINPNQILQIAADITNPTDIKNDFVYMVKVTNMENIPVQPAKWVTGTLNPDQTLNVGLSWIPSEAGEYNASVFVGKNIDSVLQVDLIKISVTPLFDGNL